MAYAMATALQTLAPCLSCCSTSLTWHTAVMVFCPALCELLDVPRHVRLDVMVQILRPPYKFTTVSSHIVLVNVSTRTHCGPCTHHTHQQTFDRCACFGQIISLKKMGFQPAKRCCVLVPFYLLPGLCTFHQHLSEKDTPSGEVSSLPVVSRCITSTHLRGQQHSTTPHQRGSWRCSNDNKAPTELASGLRSIPQVPFGKAPPVKAASVTLLGKTMQVIEHVSQTIERCVIPMHLGFELSQQGNIKCRLTGRHEDVCITNRVIVPAT